MRKKFVNYLIDPLTGKGFKLKIIEEKNNHVSSGFLFNDKNWYPIINGIPRILIKELKTNSLQSHYQFFQKNKNKLPKRVQKDWQTAIDKINDLDEFLKHQKKTGESFAYEWENIYQENDYEKNNFLHYLTPYFKEKNLKGKKLLDIGCGSGRFTKWGSLCGAQLVFGTDLGESVETAYKLTKKMNNVCIVQADIYNMPFKNQFDIAYCIGVIHHLPKPQKGFSQLPKTLKTKGKMLIWVYNRRHNKRALYLYEPLRFVLKNLPKPLLFKLSYLPGSIVHLINYFTHFFNFLKMPKLAQKIPFFNYANFPFNMKLNDAFDVLATPKSNYYYFEEIEKWFKNTKLKDVRSFEHPESGITCVGTR